MRTFLLLIIGIAFLTQGCGTTKEVTESNDATIVMDESELPNYIEKLITIKGEVSNTKIPQILGVDIVSDDPDLRGKKAMATGILESWTVKEEDIDPYSANRGAGTFYRLKDPVSGKTVQVQEAL